MKLKLLTRQSIMWLSAVAMLSPAHPAAAAEPYRVLDTTQVMGDGGIDYVYTDDETRSPSFGTIWMESGD